MLGVGIVVTLALILCALKVYERLRDNSRLKSLGLVTADLDAVRRRAGEGADVASRIKFWGNFGMAWILSAVVAAVVLPILVVPPFLLLRWGFTNDEALYAVPPEIANRFHCDGDAGRCKRPVVRSTRYIDERTTEIRYMEGEEIFFCDKHTPSFSRRGAEGGFRVGGSLFGSLMYLIVVASAFNAISRKVRAG